MADKGGGGRNRTFEPAVITVESGITVPVRYCDIVDIVANCPYYSVPYISVFVLAR